MQETTQQQFFVAIAIPFVFMISILSARHFEGHLLFHTLAELFTVLVGVTMAVVSYYTYHFTRNNFLVYLGIGYFWIAVLDLFHMLTYKGMTVYPEENVNITLTFWVLSRLLEALLLLSAPFISFRFLSKTAVFFLFSLVSAAIYWLAFSPNHLDLFVKGKGLTSLKIGIEYAVIALLLLAIFVYKKRQESFDRLVYRYLLASIAFTICAEFTLTFYVDFYGYSNMLGHLLKFLSYWMIFLAIVQTSLQRPFSSMAHDTSTYNAIPVPAIVVDVRGVVRQINQATLDFLNMAKEDVLNRSNHTLFHDKSIRESECDICQAIKSGQKLLAHELEIDTKSYRFSSSPVYFENEPSGGIQVCIDISEQKNIQQQLIRESSLLKAIIDTVPMRIFWKDRQSHFLGCNRLFAEDANVKDERDLIGKSDYEMPWREEAALYASDDKEVMQTNRSKINIEELQTQADGSKRWLNTSKAPLLDQEGRVIGLLGAYFDITDRKVAEEKLIRANQLLSNAEQMGHTGSWELDLQTKKLLWSDEVFRIHGEEVGAFIPTLEISKSYMSEEDWLKIQTAISMIEKKEETHPIRYKLNRKDGSVRDILLKKEIVVTDDDRPTKLIGILVDVTEEEASEQRLRKLKTAVEQSPVSIIITDIEGNIEYVNPHFTKITGYALEEVLGKNPRILASGQTSLDEYVGLWERVSHDEIWSGTFKNIKKNGEAYWESAIISPIKDKEGKIVNYVGIKQDITKELGMKNLLRDQEELMIVQSRHAAMGEMIGMIAHQWRQPLSVISMGANNLLLDIEMGKIEGAVFKEEANSIIEQVNHLSRTIDDFRNYFRPDKEKEVVQIEDVVREALNIIGKSLENNGIEVSLSFEQSSVIEIFRRELIQVLINVINNAKEAMNEHCKGEKKLSISTKETADEVSIEICDNGGGIDEKIIQRIFEPYFSTKDKKTGTGLGLFMSKTIMEKHLNGRIITANNDSGGTCFTLSIHKQGPE